MTFENLKTETEGNSIQLILTDGYSAMVNATEMGKLFGPNKRPSKWIELPSTKSYLKLFEDDVELSDITPIKVIKGRFSDGRRQGTWMHKLVAIRYAQWLDPKFAIWVDRKIDELLRNGLTTAIKEERDRYKSLIPKAEYFDEVLTYSDKLYTTEQISKELGMGYSSVRIHKRLQELGYIYKRGKKWFLTNSISGNNYMKTISKVIVDSKGRKRTINEVGWTENGKYWIWSLKNIL